MEITVVIPAYDMQGRGVEFLARAIASCKMQGIKDIVVSIDSRSTDLPNLCEAMDVWWCKNIRTHNAAGNLNNAINHAKGDIIKVLFQDDELGPVEQFKTIKDWGVCTSKHNTDRGDHVPYHLPDLKELALGCNTYGSPSAIAFRPTPLRFDESLDWLFDCDFYARMRRLYGEPDIVNTHVKITEWYGMATNTVCTGDVRIKDRDYIMKKYETI